MAQESLEAGGKIMDTSPRSSASRFYYASYQAMTALLRYKGDLTPSQDREAWNHEDTPNMVVAHLAHLIPQRGRREDLKNRLRLLYKIRISADYISADDVQTHLGKVRKDAEFLVKVAKGIVS